MSCSLLPISILQRRQESPFALGPEMPTYLGPHWTYPPLDLVGKANRALGETREYGRLQGLLLYSQLTSERLNSTQKLSLHIVILKIHFSLLKPV